VTPDLRRSARIGFDEAVYGAGKSITQIEEIVGVLSARGSGALFTRISPEQFAALSPPTRDLLDHDPLSATAVLGAGGQPRAREVPAIAVISAGTSDLPVAREAVRTLQYYGEPVFEAYDCGVAGLWRVLEKLERLRTMKVVVVVAGMDAALPSVIGGLVPGVVVAVPTATGYGVAADGTSALNAVLASCAPGVVVVNIGNGYGAACAALRVLGAPALPSGQEAAARPTA